MVGEARRDEFLRCLLGLIELAGDEQCPQNDQRQGGQGGDAGGGQGGRALMPLTLARHGDR